MRDREAFKRAMTRSKSDKDYERMSGLLDNSQKMYVEQCKEIELLTAKLETATSLLVTFCTGLEADKIPLPPELLDWWIAYKKDIKPNIKLVN